MRIILAYLSEHVAPGEDFMSLLPTGLPVMAAVLERAGHDVVLANLSRLTVKKAVRALVDEKPDLAGFSLFTHNRAETFETAWKVKKALGSCRVVVGGPHASPLAAAILEKESCVDWVIRGEGEEPLAALAQALAAGTPPPRGPLAAAARIDDLDALPSGLDFNGKMIGIEPRDQFALVTGSRGCVHACAFCASPELWGRRVTFRSAAALVREIAAAREKYGITYFHIRDDNFTLRRDRALEFARLVRASDLKIRFNCQARVDAVDRELLEELREAGLEHIQFGVESGSPATLARFAKDVTPEKVITACAAANAAGLAASVYLIGAIPGETNDDIGLTEKLLADARPHDAVVSPLAIFPGTGLCRQAEDDGLINDSVWFKRNDLAIFAASGDRAAIGRLERLAGIAARLPGPAAPAEKPAAGLTAMQLLLGGERHAELGHGRAAGLWFRAAAAKDERHPWTLYRLAEWQLDQGLCEDAATTAAALVRLEPKWEEARLLRDECRHATPD